MDVGPAVAAATEIQDPFGYGCILATAAFRVAPLLWNVPRHRGTEWVAQQLRATGRKELEAALRTLERRHAWSPPITARTLRIVLCTEGALQPRYAAMTRALYQVLQRDGEKYKTGGEGKGGGGADTGV